MRVIIVGGGSLGLDLSRILIEERHQVVLIEKEEARAIELAECLDCSVIHAEGTRPDILEKAEIGSADAVVAVTTHDQDNIIIGLIARTFGIPQIIIRTDDQDYLTVANKLGFHRVVNPAHTTSVIIADALRGIDTVELSTLVRGEVRFVGVMVGEPHDGKHLADLPLPGNTDYVGIYRGEDFIFARENPVLAEGDEVLVVTKEENPRELDRLIREGIPPMPL
ncbi:trk system potassium uptake protein TrkA [Methanolinea mesophila]|uniref:potassium channel family protein n=1 Tax=Methanolinea mesophila TaxID=547055 RepID=UPI001AE43132|nr:TrkA family potassium uptake protein [Methanolinea mesophila]MBP1929618.1 trk system potassium uptake protein TrkA [Methanolinea mesophila]